MSSRLIAGSLIAFLLGAGCGDDRPNGSPDAGSSSRDAAMDGSTSDMTREDAGSDAGEDDDGDMGSTEDDAGSDGGTDDMGMPTGPRLDIRTDRHWVGLDIQNDSVGFECVYLDGQGAELEDPGDLEITIDDPNATETEGRWTFADYGVYEASCSSASLGLEDSVEVIANFDPVNWRFLETSRLLDVAAQYHAQALESYATGDTQAHAEAITELEYLVEITPTLENESWIGEHPTKPWPGATEFDDAGLMEGADDDAWLAAVDELSAAAKAERDKWESLDTTAASDADLSEFQTLRADTQDALAKVNAVSPSPRTAWLERERIGDAMRALLEAGQLANEKLLTFYRANEPQPPSPGGLSVLEVVVSIGIQVAIEEASSRLGGLSYNAMLKSAGKQVIASFIGIAIKDILNLIITPAPNAPEIQSIHGSAAGFVGSGIPFTAYGSFPGGASRNLMVFIPPRVAHLLISVVDKIKSVKGAVKSTRVALKTQEIRKAVTAVYKLRDMIDEFGDVENAKSHIVFTPTSGDEMFLQYPEIPPKVNCNMLGLPVTGTMLPVHLLHGPGEAVNVNVLGESCSY